MKRYLIFSLAILAFACVEERKSTLVEDSAVVVDGKYKAVKVIESIPGGGYTYIKALEGTDTIWMAMSQEKVTIGKTYYYTEVMEMRNFASKELNRTFDKIYFLDKLLDEPREPLPGASHTQSPLGQNEQIKIEAEKGITTIGDLYANKEAFAGKTVTVKGQVTKVNNGIMDRNWVHIQDGTNSGEDYDLTITTQANLKVGDIISFTGTVAVDKDFTLGYKYELLLEDATVPDVEM